MKFTTFAKLYNEAFDYDDFDMYIAERGWQEWMDKFNEDDIVVILREIYSLAFGDTLFANLRKRLKSTQREMSLEYLIPLRTLQDWEREVAKPTIYVITSIAYTIFESENAFYELTL